MTDVLDKHPLPATLKRTRKEIAAIQTVEELVERRNKQLTIAQYLGKSKEERAKCNEHAVDAVFCEIEMGSRFEALDKAKPGPGKDRGDVAPNSKYQRELDTNGIDRTAAYRWRTMSLCPDEDLLAYFAKAQDSDKYINSHAVYRIGQKHRPAKVVPVRKLEPNTYHCLVVDPPWVMQKIEREERPNQAGFDYPPMTEDELTDPENEKWGGSAPSIIAAADCHLYLWTTHKHLPVAFRLAEAWGFKYECLMTWVKNVGFTPFSWMRSTEHILFCRKGSLPLLKLGLRLDFNAKVREHSRKPDEFYDIVKQASPGPRVDVFSRERRIDFDQWGNQTKEFAA